MALIKSAKKAIRSSARKRVFNLARLSAMRDEVKEIKKLILAKKAKEAAKLLPAAYQAIDKAAKRGVIKANAAARKKSRLSALVKKAA